nr:hypothetical protein [Tanacetum cinerariifolium]
MIDPTSRNSSTTGKDVDLFLLASRMELSAVVDAEEFLLPAGTDADFKTTEEKLSTVSYTQGR